MEQEGRQRLHTDKECCKRCNKLAKRVSTQANELRRLRQCVEDLSKIMLKAMLELVPMDCDPRN